MSISIVYLFIFSNFFNVSEYFYNLLQNMVDNFIKLLRKYSRIIRLYLIFIK